MIRIRRPLILACSALLALAFSSPASAGPSGPGEGDAAVDFEGKEFVNSGPVSLKSLRGRVVLLELFSTG